MPEPFPGFSRPTYTQVPDEVFDVLLPTLSKPELKVLLYVIRRTFGFGKDADAISISQLSEGITRRDGTKLDLGTGLPRSSVRTATKSLVDRGILDVRQVHSEEGDYAANVYSLRFHGVVQPPTHPPPANDQGVGQPPAHPLPTTDPPVGQPLALQETEEQETVHKRPDAPAHETPPFTIAELGLSSAQVWHAILDELGRGGRIPSHEIATWLRPAVLAGRDEQTLLLRTPDAASGERITRRWLPDLRSAILATTGAALDVRVIGGAQ